MSSPALTHQRRLGPGPSLRRGESAEYLSVVAIEGEPHEVRMELVGSGSPRDIHAVTPLACFVHLTDLHVTDVQSPARFEFVNREFADVRFRELLPMQRPQEALNVHAIAAMVRTINGIAAGPLTGRSPELVVTSGDAVDNVQWNELINFLALLNGGQVRIDSGGGRYEGVQAPGWPDDFFWKPDGGGEDVFQRALGFPRMPGLLDRAMQPFAAPGLEIPWLGCRGNHEVVCQGVGRMTPKLAAAMVAFHKPLRLPPSIDRDQALETFVRTPEVFMAGPDIPVTPDAERRPFDLTDFINAHGRGHGFGDGSSRARYVHDTESVRFVVLDTVCTAGGAAGTVDEEQVHWLEERLADARDRPVVIVSHHTLDTVDNVRTSGGSKRVGRDGLLEVVHGFDNVILWLNGHVHANAVRPRPDPRGRGEGFWEVTTSSVVDWPCQARLVEIFETGRGLACATTMIDHDSDPGSFSGLHRELAGNVPAAGFASARAGALADRNVILIGPRRR